MGTGSLYMCNVPLLSYSFLIRDMILLGLKLTTTEAQVKEYFKGKGDLVMVQVLDISIHLMSILIIHVLR